MLPVVQILHLLYIKVTGEEIGGAQATGRERESERNGEKRERWCVAKEGHRISRKFSH